MKEILTCLILFSQASIFAQLPKLYNEVSSSVVVLNVESLEPIKVGQGSTIGAARFSRFWSAD